MSAGTIPAMLVLGFLIVAIVGMALAAQAEERSQDDDSAAGKPPGDPLPRTDNLPGAPRRKGPSPEPQYSQAKEAAGTALMMPFLFLWMFGGPIGAIWAAVNDALVSVVLALLIPGYGALYVVVQIISSLG